MNPEHLYESITGLDDRFILEAQSNKPRLDQRKIWAGLVAALVLAVGLSWPAWRSLSSSGGSSAPSGEPSTPAGSAPAGPAPADPSGSFGGMAPGEESITVELVDGEGIEVQLLDDSVLLTNSTDAGWTGMVRILDHEFEVTIPAGETVLLDLEDLP